MYPFFPMIFHIDHAPAPKHPILVGRKQIPITANNSRNRGKIFRPTTAAFYLTAQRQSCGTRPSRHPRIATKPCQMPCKSSGVSRDPRNSAWSVSKVQQKTLEYLE